MREDARTALFDYCDSLPVDWCLLTDCLLLAQADGRVDGGIIETGKPVKQIRRCLDCVRGRGAAPEPRSRSGPSASCLAWSWPIPR